MFQEDSEGQPGVCGGRGGVYYCYIAIHGNAQTDHTPRPIALSTAALL